MQKKGKLFYTDPFVIDLEKLEDLYNFILSHTENCFIEVVSVSPREKEVRKFNSFEEFSALKNVIKTRISKLRFKGYKDNKEIIKLEFINPKGKIFPFLNSYTFKSYFKIEGEKEFDVFLASYKEKVESMFCYRRMAYMSLHAFLTSFFAVLFTTIYALMLVRNEESTYTILLVSSVLFFLFSIAFNIFFCPFLYLHNPLVKFELGINYENNKGMYFKILSTFIVNNAKQIFFALLSAIAVYFSGNLIKFLLEQNYI